MADNPLPKFTYMWRCMQWVHSLTWTHPQYLATSCSVLYRVIAVGQLDNQIEHKTVCYCSL